MPGITLSRVMASCARRRRRIEPAAGACTVAVCRRVDEAFGGLLLACEKADSMVVGNRIEAQRDGPEGGIFAFSELSQHGKFGHRLRHMVNDGA